MNGIQFLEIQPAVMNEMNHSMPYQECSSPLCLFVTSFSPSLGHTHPYECVQWNKPAEREIDNSPPAHAEVKNTHGNEQHFSCKLHMFCQEQELNDDVPDACRTSENRMASGQEKRREKWKKLCTA